VGNKPLKTLETYPANTVTVFQVDPRWPNDYDPVIRPGPA